MRVAEGPDACAEHEWVSDAQITTSDESHVVRVCRHCSAVALIGPELPIGDT
ncbi:hypothetical protein LL946_11065 [Knoellia locipacati]|uniref:hypothetical protein n=1 Tax=Knoellia locipacati TaxID=882824 RepID=UPI00384BD7AB